MPRIRRAAHVRSIMSQIAVELSEKGATTDEVLSAFYQRHADSIEKDLTDIVHLGLKRIAGDLARSRMGTGEAEQLELFGQKTPATMHVWTLANGKSVRKIKQTALLTYRELKYHHNYIVEKKSQAPVKVDHTQDLLDRLKSAGATDDSVVGEFAG